MLLGGKEGKARLFASASLKVGTDLQTQELGGIPETDKEVTNEIVGLGTT